MAVFFWQFLAFNGMVFFAVVISTGETACDMNTGRDRCVHRSQLTTDFGKKIPHLSGQFFWQLLYFELSGHPEKRIEANLITAHDLYLPGHIRKVV